MDPSQGGYLIPHDLYLASTMMEQEGYWVSWGYYRGIKSTFGLGVRPKTASNYLSDPGGYWWPPTISKWLKTIFWPFWQFTIFSRF
jgi:hypothetical protein